VTEIDIQVDLKFYRTVVKYPLGLITARGLREVVRNRVESWGQRPIGAAWSLKYKDREGILHEVDDTFPHSTDGSWREYFAAVFYVDF